MDQKYERKSYCEMKIHRARVTKEPVMTYTPTGKAVTRFSVSYGGYWDKEKKEETVASTWKNVKCWGTLAENTYRELKKGQFVYLEGIEDTSEYKGKKYDSLTAEDVQIELETGERQLLAESNNKEKAGKH
ncbi:single-stranded DNA-binding protein [Dehalococcoides mccartyi]|uniref:single-stranded DNA-binding protein n=1 Tax=Dehalococcoides mccartyi TaxID=61435 RepID=UPI0006BC2B3B|nr:single-stranded DNA-binding protein [Dehalococcoides mccartyi]AOV98744.1 hypothetical protein DCWBC2_0067 [Dehalococcoides mccartyi]BAS31151.1 single-strand binding protein/ primosomal replication protein [Dehalococcoides mccartyi IBARAKI]